MFLSAEAFSLLMEGGGQPSPILSNVNEFQGRV